jgi:hypothetical protein
MVTMVLLKVEWIYTLPCESVRFGFRPPGRRGVPAGLRAMSPAYSLGFPRSSGLPSVCNRFHSSDGKGSSALAIEGKSPGLLLLGASASASPSDGLLGPFARAGIGAGALTPHRKTAAVPQASVATDLHQTLDVHLHLAP